MTSPWIATKPTKFFLCGRNLFDESTLSATVAAEDSLPLENMQSSLRERVWRCTTGGPVDIVISMAGTSERLNFLKLHRHNFEPAADWRIRAYTSYDGTGVPLFDTGHDPAWDASTLGSLDFGVDPFGAGIFDSFLGQMYSLEYFLQNTDVINSIKLSLDDNGNSAGFIQASRIYTGRGVELDLDIESAELSWQNDTALDRTDGGSIASDGSLSWRELSVAAKITKDQRAEIMDIWRFAGKTKDLFLSVFPGDEDAEKERDYTMLCRFKEMPRISLTPDLHQAEVFDAKMDFVEI